MRWLHRVLLLFVLSSACFGQGITYLRIHRPVIEEQLKLSADKQEDRLRALRSLFEKGGCPSNRITEQAVPGQAMPNLICTLPGTEEGTIVVGASAAYKDRGERGKVQWAGLAMLSLLAESLDSVAHRRTFEFVAFTGRLQEGSSAYSGEFTEDQRRQTLAMIDLNEIGRTPPIYVSAQEDETLGKWLATAARTLKLRYLPVEVSARAMAIRAGLREIPVPVAEADAKSFSRYGIPSITLRSLTEMPVEGLTHPGGSPVTRLTTSVDVQAFEDTYSLLTIFLLALDRELGKKSTNAPGVLMAESKAPESAPATPPAQPASVDTKASAQSAAPPPSVPPSASESQNLVLHAQAQLVQVDVSVLGKDGRPVQGLKQSDFTVFEDGKPQEIRAFEAHTTETAQEKPRTLSSPLPPNTYSNRTEQTSEDAVSFILFDVLNTPAGDQINARRQLIEFINGLPPGRRIALFALGGHLRLVQGFTTEPQLLRKAADKLLADQTLLLTSERDNQQTKGQVEGVARLGAPGGAPAGSSGPTQDQATRIEQSIAVMESERTDQRISFTLGALDAIARMASGYPGRKNLVWLSGSFPIEIRPDITFYDMNSGTDKNSGAVAMNAKRDYREQIRGTTALLAASRVAVYPVDVRGVQGSGVDISLGATDAGAYTGSEAPGAFSTVLRGQSDTRFSERTSMVGIADQTGGEAFTGTNDIRHAIERSMNDGSNYYTLAYRPEQIEKDPSYHRIQVKLAREAVKLAYRQGYFSSPSTTSEPQSSFHELAVAMQPENPLSTMLSLDVKVLPPDQSHSAIRIDYTVDPKGLKFVDAPNRSKRVLADFMVVAFDKNGRDAGHLAQTLDAAFSEGQFSEATKNGLTMHQEITLPAGSYTLRLGVMDRASQRVGTVDVRLTVGDDIAKKVSAEAQGNHPDQMRH